MSPTTVRKFKWIWGWQDNEEEAWLRQMAQAGLHLKSPGTFGFYTFERGEPADYAYRLDFHDAPKRNYQEYLQLFKDAGWEHLGEALGWQYFRKRAKPGEAPEIFTDAESKTQKYQRLLNYVLAMLPLYLIVWLVALDSAPTAVSVIFVTLAAINAAFALKIWQRINQLKRI